MFVSQKHLLVEWGHCDPAGIVFYPQYLAWFDDCTTALFGNAGMATRALFKEHGILGVPLVDVRVRFLIPSTFNDELLAESTRDGISQEQLYYSAPVLQGRGTGRGRLRDAGVDRAGSDESGAHEIAAVPAAVIERLSASGTAAGKA